MHTFPTRPSSDLESMQLYRDDLPFNLDEVIREMHRPKIGVMKQAHGGGCPGSAERKIQKPQARSFTATTTRGASELRQWPLQMHLINPPSSLFAGSDMVLAAHCAAFAMGYFHTSILKGKTVGIIYPKLDQGGDISPQKLLLLNDQARINTLTVVVMEV